MSLAQRISLLMIGIAVLACTSSTATAQPVQYVDGTFDPSNWFLIIDVWGGGGDVTATQIPAGGNPGTFRQITHHLNPNPPPPNCDPYTTVWGNHFNSQAVYDPAVMGAIESIDYSESYTGAVQANGIELLQNDFLYWANSGVQGGPSWITVVNSGLRAEDFSTWYENAPVHPDFSSLGAPITFGFGRGNSNGSGCGVGGGNNTAYIDNWSVTIHRAASVPTVSGWGCLVLILLVLTAGSLISSRQITANFLK